MLTRHPLEASWRRLLAGALVLCVTLAAVPALAHCCADRCHDAEPPVAQADDCHCTLAGMVPPVDAISVAPDPKAAPVCIGYCSIDADIAPTVYRAIDSEAAAPRGAPDRTVVLRI